MSKKQVSSSNKSTIEDSDVRIERDYIVGGKGNRNYYFNFPTWGILLLLAVILTLGIFALQPQFLNSANASTNTGDTSTLAANRTLPETVVSKSAPTVSAPPPPTQNTPVQNNTPPARRSPGTHVRIVVEAADQDIQAMATSLITERLLEEGLKVVGNSQVDVDLLLRCKISSQVIKKEIKRTMYLPKFSAQIRILQLPEETIHQQFSLSSHEDGFTTMLSREDAILRAFDTWFRASLQKESLRKKPS